MSTTTHLRVLDESALSRELDLVSELFHRINRIIPESQQVISFPPTLKARDAIELLLEHGYSQAPVIEAGEVLGVFSYRSFALKAAAPNVDHVTKQGAPGDFAVVEYLEQFDFARVTEELSRVFSAMERDNGILVGTPEKLVGILTPMDFLNYLYKIASPFVMISEIELTLRALVRLCVDDDELEAMAIGSLSQLYGPGRVPKRLEDMSFNDQRMLIVNGDNWEKFSRVFGANRALVSGKLNQVSDLRNTVFHFKRETTLRDHEALSELRGWLLVKTKRAELQRKSGRVCEEGDVA